MLPWIESTRSIQPFPGCLYASLSFVKPYPAAVETNILSLAIILLLEAYCDRIDSPYKKLTVGFTLRRRPHTPNFTFTLKNAMVLCDTKGQALNRGAIYLEIEQRVRLVAERYIEGDVQSIFINFYFEMESKDPKLDMQLTLTSKLASKIKEYVLRVLNGEIDCSYIPAPKSLLKKPSRRPTKVTAIRSKKQLSCRPFLVADLERVIVNHAHIAYAAGYMEVIPGTDLTVHPLPAIHTFYSESRVNEEPSFETRSRSMLNHFLRSLLWKPL